MRKKKMCKRVIGLSVGLMMMFVLPNVQAANNDVVSMKKSEETSVKPSVKCNQKVFNLKDDVTLSFSLGKGAEKADFIEALVLFTSYEGEEGELDFLENEYKIDYKTGTITVSAKGIINTLDTAFGYMEGDVFGLGVRFNGSEKNTLGGNLVIKTKGDAEIPWTDLEPSKPIEKPEKPEIPWTDLEPAKPIEKPELQWSELTPAKPIEGNNGSAQAKPNTDTTVNKDDNTVAYGNTSATPKTSDTSDVIGLTSVGLGAFGLAVAELLRKLRK